MMSNDKNSSQPKIVPFGKYKGQPIEVLAADPKYVEWLNGQGWVKDRHPQFYTVIINNFQEPSDTPEHNALQVLFLDDTFCMQFLSMLVHPNIDRFWFRRFVLKRFEVNGIDVILDYDIFCHKKYYRHVAVGVMNSEILEYATGRWDCGIEIKPSIGDDYPSVLRQSRNMKRVDQRCVLFRDFTATSVSIDQVREMFRLSGVLLFSLDEVQQAEIDTRFDEWVQSHVKNPDAV